MPTEQPLPSDPQRPQALSARSAPAPLRARRGPRVWLERYGALLALVMLIVATAAIEHFRVPPESRAFLTSRNFANILGQWAYVGIVAVGMTFVIILGGIDLSVGSIVALAAGAAVYALNAVAGAAPDQTGWAVAAAIAVCLLGGPLLGWVNGVVIAKGRIAPFVATLGTMAIFRALILAPADGSEIRATVPAFGVLSDGFQFKGWGGGGALLTIRYPVLVLVGVALLAHLVLSRTVFGLNVYAIGDNARAARYAGVKNDRVTMLVYTIAGLACGLAALLNASRLGSVGSNSLGTLYELDAIAAVVIGGTRLQGGAGSVPRTIVGVLILGVVSNMLNMLGVSAFYHGLVKGCIIIAAVLIQPSKATD